MGEPNRPPAVGDAVHFVIDVGDGTADDGTQLYRTVCRAGVVTALDDRPETSPGEVWVDLAVLHPAALEFVQTVRQDEAPEWGGTWHWPEQVGSEDEEIVQALVGEETRT